MNFTSERNKPIFVTRPGKIASFNAERTLNEALADQSVFQSRGTHDFMVKFGAAKKFPRTVLISVNEATSSELKELVVTRLQGDSTEKFQFLDGRTFSGSEAAREVKEGSKVGEYFLELEKETLKIIQDAFFNGNLG